MRVLLSLILMCSGAMAESHPSWWTLASPDATAIVGIQWENLKSSPFGDAVAGELTSSIGLPGLACLTEAKQILISSPGMLAIITGNFKSVTLRQQAAKVGMKTSSYQGVELWISPGKTLSLAQLSDQMLLAGTRKTLEAAIDRSQGQTRRYSPLLARAARYAQADLWAVANKLPDPLASIFVPLDASTGGFEGYLTVGAGLDIEASLDGISENGAAELAESARQSIPDLPEMARGLQVKVEGRNVFLSLELSAEQFTASLRNPPARVEAAPSVEAPVAVMVPAAAAAPAAPAPVEPAKAVGPQVIRIVGLDDGPREIILPPAPKPDKP